MLNLLSLQSEISSLRDKFWIQCKADEKSGAPFNKFSTNFEAQRGSDNAKQNELLLEIRNKMKEYSKPSVKDFRR